MEKFRRSLREIAGLGINPVSIPKEWSIRGIPNLLRAYERKVEKDRAEEFSIEILQDYISERKRKGKEWW